MIPFHPNFSDITDLAPYPDYGAIQPRRVRGVVSSVSIGPQELADPSSPLTSRYWTAYQSSGNVVIRGEVNGQWGDEFVLFSEPGNIVEIGLTFDQVGRPTVAIEVAGEVKLFWFDPLIPGQTVATIAPGRNPRMTFDYPLNPENPDSDMLLFYIDGNNTLTQRLQRDRWSTAYDTSVSGPNLKLYDVAIDIRNRLQVEYSGADS